MKTAKEVIRFLIIGLILISSETIFFVTICNFIELSYANILSKGIVSTLGFFLHKAFTYNKSCENYPYYKYMVVAIIMISFSTLIVNVSYGIIDGLFSQILNLSLSKIIAESFCAIITFISYKYWVYNEK